MGSAHLGELLRFSCPFGTTLPVAAPPGSAFLLYMAEQDYTGHGLVGGQIGPRYLTAFSLQLSEGRESPAHSAQARKAASSVHMDWGTAGHGSPRALLVFL